MSIPFPLSPPPPQIVGPSLAHSRPELMFVRQTSQLLLPAANKRFQAVCEHAGQRECVCALYTGPQQRL
jgi:hypothetical protein